LITGDVITAVNGHVVKDAHDLAKQIGSMTPGATVKLTVWRKGEEKSFSLTLGELPKSRQARATNPDSEATAAGLPKLGMTVAPAEGALPRQVRRTPGGLKIFSNSPTPIQVKPHDAVIAN
jgi:hypothetical protein